MTLRDLDKFDRRKKLIDPYDWCFGETNDVFVHIRNILGLDLMSPELERWQIKNKNERVTILVFKFNFKIIIKKTY